MTDQKQERFLIFDVDKSLASIGNKEELKSATADVQPYGVNAGVVQVGKALSQLFNKTEIKEKHVIFGDEQVTVGWLASPLGQKATLSGVVVDSITHLFRQDMRILEEARANKALEMTDWGTLDRHYSKLFQMLKELPVFVVATAHVKKEKNDLSGGFYFGTQLKGSAGEYVFEYFDVVCYTRVSQDAKKPMFMWQTVADTQRFAKNRGNLLPPLMPQDIGHILREYRKAGYPHPKILVIGESGTGKTMALKTINSVNTVNPVVSAKDKIPEQKAA